MTPSAYCSSAARVSGLISASSSLGDPAPPHGADEPVALQGRLAEQLRQPAGRRVPPDVHLVEALLGVHETLGAHQVGGRVGVDLRDAVRVADHRHLRVETGEPDLAVDLRERPPHQHHAGDQRRRPGRAPAPRRGTSPSGRCAASRGMRATTRGVRCLAGVALVMVRPILPRRVELAVGPAECQPVRLRTEERRAHVPVRLHRVRARLRPGPVLHRRHADQLPGVHRPAAQGVQRRRRRLQGLRLLPQRQPRQGRLGRLVRRRRARRTPRPRRRPSPSPRPRAETKAETKSSDSATKTPAASAATTSRPEAPVEDAPARPGSGLRVGRVPTSPSPFSGPLDRVARARRRARRAILRRRRLLAALLTGDRGGGRAPGHRTAAGADRAGRGGGPRPARRRPGDRRRPGRRVEFRPGTRAGRAGRGPGRPGPGVLRCAGASR